MQFLVSLVAVCELHSEHLLNSELGNPQTVFVSNCCKGIAGNILYISKQKVLCILLISYVISGVGNFQQASNYLSQAQWIVLRTPDCSGAFQHRLHRSLGLLCAADGNFDQALYHLANDVSQ